MTMMLNHHPEPLSPEQISKLPKWAREHVRRVERYGDEQTRVIEEMKGERTEPIAVRDPYGAAAPVAWDRYDEVRFALRGTCDEDTRDWVAVRRREEGHIEVVSSGTLVITSVASNVFRVTTEER